MKHRLRLSAYGGMFLALLAFWVPAGTGLFVGGCSDVTSTVAASANAGEDQDIITGDKVTLDGQSSGGVDSVQWTFDSRPTGSSASFEDAASLSPMFTADVAGTYVAKLSINSGASTDTMSVTAKNIVSTLTVPSDSAITTRKRFNTTENVVNLQQTGATLTASTSRGSIASYKWEQVAGPSATAVGGTTSAAFQFTAPALSDFLNDTDRYKWQVLPVSREDTKMTFKVTTSDSSGNTDSGTIDVYVQESGSEIHTSSGLPNVAVGALVRLSGPNLKAVSGSASTAITDWSWSLTVPAGSSAKFSDSGTTSSTIEFPQFTPDVKGIYTVNYSSTSGGVTSGTLSINVGDWSGVGTIGGTTPANPQCATCHDGSVEANKVTGWSSTKHASVFKDNVGTYAGLAPEPYLWQFHTVGFDKNASNSGFDDLASTVGFTFPAAGLAYSDFTTTYSSSVAKLSNVQCENCHGPGSEHGGDPLRISYSSSQFGVCGQCHIQENSWINSMHNSTGVSHGSGAYQSAWVNSAGCVRCHSSKGFSDYLAGTTLAAITETGAFPGITCAACHDPHSATNEKQLRLKGNVTMVIDGSTVDAGKAAVCYTCHDGLYEYDQTSCDSNSDGNSDAKCTTADQAATQYVRQVHYNPQAPLLEGKGILTDLNADGTADLSLTENSFHSGSTFILSETTGDSTLSTTNDKCITCHMATGPTSDQEGYLHLGGHAFKLRVGHGIGHLNGEENGDTTTTEAEEDKIQLTSACTKCHPSVTSLNRTARADYDGDGSQEGIQDEVKGLLLNLSVKIKALDTANIKSTSGTTSSGSTITPDAISFAGSCSSFSGTCKAAAGTSSCTNVATGKTRDDYQQCNFLDTSAVLRRAIWNHNAIVRDGSLGVHNAAFTIQAIQGTYKAIEVLLDGKSASTFTYKTDFPNATLR